MAVGGHPVLNLCGRENAHRGGTPPPHVTQDKFKGQGWSLLHPPTIFILIDFAVSWGVFSEGNPLFRVVQQRRIGWNFPCDMTFGMCAMNTHELWSSCWFGFRTDPTTAMAPPKNGVIRKPFSHGSIIFVYSLPLSLSLFRVEIMELTNAGSTESFPVRGQFVTSAVWPVIDAPVQQGNATTGIA